MHIAKQVILYHL